MNKVMKANAPEKIYIPRLEGSKSFVHEWSATKFRKYFNIEVAENAEYTRTDAFIEKARKWFEKQPELYDANGVRCYSTEDFEDFRKYMEGK